MNLSEQLKVVVGLLQSSKVRYALAGGLVASLYRQNARMTADLDFLILSGSSSETEAKKILNACGLEAFEVRKAQLEGGPKHAIKSRSSPVLLIAGRPAEPKAQVGVDFLLPGFPWFESALGRAEGNRIDFGFGPIPCLTAEDIVLSKIYASANRSDRFQDFDDIKEIFAAGRSLDLNYLSDQIRALDLRIAVQLKDSVPEVLWKTSRHLS